MSLTELYTRLGDILDDTTNGEKLEVVVSVAGVTYKINDCDHNSLAVTITAGQPT